MPVEDGDHLARQFDVLVALRLGGVQHLGPSRVRAANEENALLGQVVRRRTFPSERSKRRGSVAQRKAQGDEREVLRPSLPQQSHERARLSGEKGVRFFLRVRTVESLVEVLDAEHRVTLKFELRHGRFHDHSHDRQPAVRRVRLVDLRRDQLADTRQHATCRQRSAGPVDWVAKIVFNCDQLKGSKGVGANVLGWFVENFGLDIRPSRKSKPTATKTERAATFAAVMAAVDAGTGSPNSTTPKEGAERTGPSAAQRNTQTPLEGATPETPTDPQSAAPETGDNPEPKAPEPTKYMAPEESIQDHAASAMAASILAMILSKDRAVQRKGCAWAFHSWMKARTRSSRVSRSAKLGAVMRLRCRMENHCSTWFIHEQCTGVKCI